MAQIGVDPQPVPASLLAIAGARGADLIERLEDLVASIGFQFGHDEVTLTVATSLNTARRTVSWLRPGTRSTTDCEPLLATPLPAIDGVHGELKAWARRASNDVDTYADVMLSGVTVLIAEAVARDEMTRRFEAAFDHGAVGFSIREADGLLLECNTRYAEMVGSTVTELIGGRPPGVVHPDDLPGVHERVQQTIESGQQHLIHEFRMLKGGSLDDVRWCRSTSTAVRWGDGSLRYMMAVFEDIHERKVGEQALKESELRYRGLIEHAPMVVLNIGPDDRIGFASSEVYVALGLDPESLPGEPLQRLGLGLDELGAWTQAMRNVRSTGLDTEIETRFSTGRGDRWLSGRIAPSGTDGSVTVYAFDVTERHRMQAQIEHAARHDPLTGLANRTMFLQQIDEALRRQRRYRGPLAVLFVDLDRFKVVNDHLGHAAGDQVLSQVAKRLVSTVRDIDSVGRLGGDEFVVLLENCGSPDSINVMADRVREVLSQPFVVDASGFTITASVGVVVHFGGPALPDELVRDADRAMYRAKRNGRDRVEVFDDGLRDEVAARAATEAALRRALPRGELDLYVQPEVDLRSRRIVGCEALVRWLHPERGLLAAAEFVELAEESGVIVDIDTWMVRESLRWLARWRTAGHDVHCRINLSRRSLVAHRIGEVIAAELASTGVDPASVGFEVTESAVAFDIDAMRAAVKGIRALGTTIAIDDFGTGYSSLSMLRSFEVDVLKLDRSFVSSLGEDHEADAIVETVVSLAQALDLMMVAEGVETEAQAARLVELGCPRAQGWLFGRPIPASQFIALL